jgi:plasmid stabilization system protein ParE
MADSYIVKITPYAESAVREIGQYIALDLHAPQNAIRTLSAIRQGIKSLDHMPARIPRTPDEPWGSEGIRRMQIKHFYVYFWIDEDRSIVQVTNVVHVGREQKAQLSQMDME